MVKAFIFDVDGTLADTERHGHRVAFNQAFEQFGLDWHWSEETYGELLAVTGGKERMAHFVRTHDKPEKDREDLGSLIKQLHARKTENYVSLLKRNAIPLRPGVKRLLQDAREQKIRLAIATTTTPENITALLENALGPESIAWFDVIGAGDIVPEKKPAADIYHYVLRHMNLNADDCLAFEDSINGLRASLGAGIKTIITHNGYTEQDDFTGAELVLDHFGDEDHPSTVLHQTFRQDYLSVDLIGKILQ
jgi:beta-phosphoglucomutase-like phosphatase (HAD superfamily)